jgi:O-antigen/teichoic acid export membrane protein
VVTALVAFLLTPFLLDHLGPDAYGVWLLSLTFSFAQGYAALADLGLRQAAIREVSQRLARGDTEGAARIVSALAVFYGGLAGMIAIALAFGSSILVSLFGVPDTLARDARVVFALAGVQLIFDLSSAGLATALEGAQAYSRLRIIDVTVRIGWAVAIVVLVKSGFGLVSLAVAAIAFAALGTVLTALCVHATLPDVRLLACRVEVRRVRHLSGEGRWFGALQLVSVVYRQMDRLIVGIVIGTAAVSRYEIAYKLQAVSAIALSIVPSALLPAAAQLGASADNDRLHDLYLRGTRYAVGFCLPIAIAVIVLTEPLIRAWVSPEYTDMVVPTQLFVSWTLLAVFHVIGATMLAGIGHVRTLLVLATASIGLNLVLSIALAPRWGVTGVIMGTLIGYAVVWVPYLFASRRVFLFDYSAWFGAVVRPMIVPIAAESLALVIAWLFVRDASALWRVGLAMAATIAIAWVVFVFVSLSHAERRSLIGAMRAGAR